MEEKILRTKHMEELNYVESQSVGSRTSPLDPDRAGADSGFCRRGEGSEIVGTRTCVRLSHSEIRNFKNFFSTFLCTCIHVKN